MPVREYACSRFLQKALHVSHPTILLTGAGGQVGSALVPLLAPLGPLVALDRRALDLTDAPAVQAALRQHRPQLVINAAAYTAVDRAETDASTAFAVNAQAPEVMAQVCGELGAALIHYSTDYVFAGSKPTPYLETDPTGPLGVYGRSKLAGEQALLHSATPSLIFRTSWVFSRHGHNFLNTMLRLGQERPQLGVVDDQWGAPTWAGSIAQATLAIVQQASAGPTPKRSLAEFMQSHRGLYHMTNQGATTWFGFAQAIFERYPQCTARLQAIPTRDYPTPVQRPANSRLSNERLAQVFGIRLAHWQQALQECLDQPPTIPL